MEGYGAPAQDLFSSDRRGTDGEEEGVHIVKNCKRLALIGDSGLLTHAVCFDTLVKTPVFADILANYT